MNLIEAIGSLCLGIVVGWLVRYFIRRFKTYSPSILGSLLTVFLGGSILKLVSTGQDTFWFYSIGIFCGFVIYSLIAYICLRKGNKLSKNGDGILYDNK
jgi:NhaP-type Na+/H+ or K+/H+ antiporter